MSTKSGATNDTAQLMSHSESIPLWHINPKSDADGRMCYSGEFVSATATGSRSWRWKLLRSEDSRFYFCIKSVSDCAITLSSVVLYGWILTGRRVSMTEKQNIGQPSYQSGDFSVDANSLPRWVEAFTRNLGIWIALELELKWFEEEMKATPIPLSPASVLKLQYNKVIKGGDAMFDLVSSDDQSFRVNVAILEAKSVYFKQFFATDGWKDQMDGRMELAWTSDVVRQLIHYVYLNDVDGDVCELLPDIMEAAQMWELIGMKALIEAQMKQRLEKAAWDADTDMAADYLKMAHLHGLVSLLPICNGVLADNFDEFYDSDQFKQIEQNETYRHLVKDIIHHIRK